MRIVACTTGTSIAAGVPRLDSDGNPERYLRGIRTRIDEVEKASGDDFHVKISAETNSLGKFKLNQEDRVTLLHTETEDGVLCAKETAKLIREQWKCVVDLMEVKGLQVRKASEFRKTGIHNLFRCLDRIRESHPEAEMVLNVTGGFKSVVPFATLYGLIHRLDIIYLHETAAELIHLPPVPLTFDFERLGEIRDAMLALRKKDTMDKKEFERLLPPSARINSDWYRSLIEEEGAFVSPSGLASMFFKETDEHTSRVLLSSNARKSLDASSGPVRTQYMGMLQRVRDPMWRQHKIHAVQGTDLTVFKPGNTRERLIGFVRGRDVYVCELEPHNEYLRTLSSRSVANYPVEDFGEFVPPADAADLPVSEEAEMDRLRREIEQTRRSSEEMLEEVERREREAEQTMQGWNSEKQGLLEEMNSMEQDLRDARNLVAKARDYLDRPWWKRVLASPASIKKDFSNDT